MRDKNLKFLQELRLLMNRYKHISIDGDFNCFACSSLTSLEGAPKVVGGNFDCGECDNLIIISNDTEKYKIQAKIKQVNYETS